MSCSCTNRLTGAGFPAQPPSNLVFLLNRFRGTSGPFQDEANRGQGDPDDEFSGVYGDAKFIVCSIP